MKTALYIVEITGTNSSDATASAGDLAFSAHPDYATNKALIRLDSAPKTQTNEGDMIAPVALFEDRDQAHSVGLACRWNNQRYNVRAARGRVREEGARVSLPDGPIVGCQEGWRP